MTQEDEDQAFAAIIRFNWTNEDWGLTFLPQVRLAALVVTRSDSSLQDILADFVKDGAAPELLNGLRTTDRLRTLVELTDEALAKSSAILDGMGDGPQNPPPILRSIDLEAGQAWLAPFFYEGRQWPTTGLKTIKKELTASWNASGNGNPSIPKNVTTG